MGCVKNLSVMICDGAPSTAHSRFSLTFSVHVFFSFSLSFLLLSLTCPFLTIFFFHFSFVFDFNGLVSMF